MAFIATVLVVLLILIAAEFWWRHHQIHEEVSRKFVHITVGSFVACWPFFLSWTQIELLSVDFLLVIGVSRYFKIFSAIHSVQRPTWGEAFFAIAVGGIALLTHHKGIYATALLQMSLADGLAAVVGQRYGTTSRYQILGNTKSVIGTATFFIVSLALLIGYMHYSATTVTLPYAIGLALVASVIENVGVYGLDNILVPLVIAAALRSGL